MYELVPVGERTYYIDCPAKIGVVRFDSGVYLIDSGSDTDAAKKVRRILEQNDWPLLGILNTHSHADHIGGNRFLQEQTGCKIFSGGIEADFIRHPILEPSFLYGGFPPDDLRHKFLLAQESAVTDFSDPAFPREIEIIPLPGHSFDMAGFRTPDGVMFLADSVNSPATLEKYGVFFLHDVEAFLATLDKVEQMHAALFVPSHAEPTDNCRELVRLNREKVQGIGDRIVSLCEEPCIAEELLTRLFAAYDLTMTFQQHALIGSTLRSYLSWLKQKGQLTVQIQGNSLLWQAAG